MSSTHCFCLLVGGWRATALKPLRAIVQEELTAIRAEISELEADAAVLKSTLFLRIFSLRDRRWESDHPHLIRHIATRLILELKRPVWIGEFNGYSSPSFEKCQADGQSSSVTKSALQTELGWGPKNLQADADEGGLYLSGGKRVSLGFEVLRPTTADRARNLHNAMQRKPIGPMVDAWLAAARSAQVAGHPSPGKSKARSRSAPPLTEMRFVFGDKEEGPEDEALKELHALTNALAGWCDQLGLEIAAAASAARIETHYRFGSRLDVLIEWTENRTDLAKGLDLFEHDGRGRVLQQELEALEPPGPTASRDDRETYGLQLQRLANLLFGCGAFARGFLEMLMGRPGADKAGAVDPGWNVY